MTSASNNNNSNNENEFQFPTSEERRKEIGLTVEDLRKRIEQDRVEGRARGEELFGTGALGRLGTSQALTQATQQAQSNPFLQQAQAGAEGLNTRLQELSSGGLIDEAVLQRQKEQAVRGIDQATLTALRTQRGLSSGQGITGETAKAREADILKSSVQSQRDLELGFAIDRLNRQQQESQFQLGVAQTQLGSLQNLGQLAQTGQAQTALLGQLGQAGQQVDIFNLQQAQREKEKQLQTEVSNVGLAAAIESGGAARALEALNQDVTVEFGKRNLALEQQAVDKPAPEAPGKFALCTELHRQGKLSDDVYEADQMGAKEYSTEAMIGYHFWAKPLAKLMSKSKLVTAILSPIIKSWANHMAYKQGVRSKDNKFGRTLERFGVRACEWIGARVHKSSLKVPDYTNVNFEHKARY